MNEAVENVLVLLDEFRTNNEITYSAYSTLHDEISLIDDRLKEQEPIPPKHMRFTHFCGKCSAVIYREYKCCPFCGQEIMWNADITD